MTRSRIGDAPKRREDVRFLTGRGTYLDDVAFDNVVHAVVLRSPHAHADIKGIDSARARTMPGVLAVLTGEDVVRDKLGSLPPTAEANVKTGERYPFLAQPLLAVGKVRHVGEGVALIVAESVAQALDAAEAVEVDYAPLPAIVSTADARAKGAAEIAAEVPGNVLFDWRTGDAAGAAAGFAKAAHTVSMRVVNHRIVTNPMEPRGAVGLYDAVSERYTLHVSSQSVFVNRDIAARCLGVPPERVRLLAHDIGGAFGAKNFIYPEFVLLLWAARKLGRSIKWIATRSEVFTSDHQARDHEADARIALDARGRILALEVDCVANAGAYMRSIGNTYSFQFIHLPTAVYRIPAVSFRIAGVLTNTTPVGVTRAPGFAEAVNLMERLIDKAARQCGFDRVELRRINMWPSHAMPMTNAFDQKVDSGAFAETLDRAVTEADVAGFAARRTASAAKGQLRGLGIAYHIKGTGGFPSENADIRFEADGSVSLVVGTHSVGQGHETTFPQIVAERLGLEDRVIRHRQADTDLLPMGGGSGSSRSTYMAGTAIWRACDEIIAKGTRVAAGMLEAAEADVRFDDGRFVVAGTDRGVGLLEVAARARRDGTPLDSYHRWTREWMTFPNGAHVVEVELDRETGEVRIDRYTAVDDYGEIINPMVVTGQAHGAIVHGIGHALFEHAAYDARSGQPLAGSFMDYAMARADDIPHIALSFNGTRCTTNPLGVKGVGEAGMVGAYPAVANAIDDALAPLGAPTLDGPATPERIWRMMRGKQV